MKAGRGSSRRSRSGPTSSSLTSSSGSSASTSSASVSDDVRTFKRRHQATMHMDLEHLDAKQSPHGGQPSTNGRSLTPTELETSPGFRSCLQSEAGNHETSHHGVLLTPNTTKSGRNPDTLDKHLVMSIDLRAEGADASDSWLTGVFIDYIFQRFAQHYEDTIFLPTAFAAVQLPQLHRICRSIAASTSTSSSSSSKPRDSLVERFRSFTMDDVLGRHISPAIWNRRRQSLLQYRQILMLHNAGANHWTLIRIIPPKFVKKPTATELRIAAEKAAATEKAATDPAAKELPVSAPPPPEKKRSRKALQNASRPVRHFPAPAEVAPAGKIWDFTTGRWVSMRNMHKKMVEATNVGTDDGAEDPPPEGVGPQMHLFEPMGKPSGRGKSRGVSRRSLPEGVLEWLDAVCPLNHLNAPAAVRNDDGDDATSPPTTERRKKKRTVRWKSCSQSVLTTAKQKNSFDCGVASLLYAECCALGWTMEEMTNDIGQAEITQYRTLLEKYIKAIAGVGATTAQPSPKP